MYGTSLSISLEREIGRESRDTKLAVVNKQIFAEIMNVRWEDRELRRKVRRVMEFGVIR